MLDMASALRGLGFQMIQLATYITTPVFSFKKTWVCWLNNQKLGVSQYPYPSTCCKTSKYLQVPILSISDLARINDEVSGHGQVALNFLWILVFDPDDHVRNHQPSGTFLLKISCLYEAYFFVIKQATKRSFLTDGLKLCMW